MGEYIEKGVRIEAGKRVEYEYCLGNKEKLSCSNIYHGVSNIFSCSNIYHGVSNIKKKKAGSQIPAFSYSHMMVLCEPKMIL